MPQVIANGRPLEIAGDMPLPDFLTAHGFPPKSVVVEHNGEAVAPSEFGTRIVRSGDRMEIVQIVAGG